MKNFIKKIFSLLLKNQSTPNKNQVENTKTVQPEKTESNIIQTSTLNLPPPNEELEETLVATLRSLNIKDSSIFWNSYIPCKPYNNVDLTEIDVALVTPKGIILFEVKNYTGTIEGNFNSKYWTVKYSSGAIFCKANAIKQNNHHKNALMYNTHIDSNKIITIEYLNCVDFNGDIDDANVIFHGDNSKYELSALINKVLNNPLSPDEYEDVSNLLHNGMLISEEIKNTHLENLNLYINS
ncbi:MAG: nuclease-related domain-containing protein [Clostridium sp.]